MTSTAQVDGPLVLLLFDEETARPYARLPPGGGRAGRKASAGVLLFSIRGGGDPGARVIGNASAAIRYAQVMFPEKIGTLGASSGPVSSAAS